MKIFKYPLSITDRQVVRMPHGARILSIQQQKVLGTDMVHTFLWAEIDEGNVLEDRCIRIYGTGHGVPTDDGLSYLATVVTADGSFVWHFYEKLFPAPERTNTSTNSGGEWA